LCQRHTDPTRGARDLQRAIEDEIVAPLTDKLLAGEIKPGMKLMVGEGAAIDMEQTPRRAPVAQEPPLQPEVPFIGQDRFPMRAADVRHFDLREKRNREIIVPLLAKLREQLHAQGIEVELDEGVWELLCSPFWAEQRAGLDVEDAFVQFVQEPLMRRVQAGEFQGGDQLEVYRTIDLKVDFRKKQAGGQ
jgi:ATP-dependent Clp protease ATP-binding subunit ClpA